MHRRVLENHSTQQPRVVSDMSEVRKITAIGSRKRDHILRAAEQEFERYGFSGARMQRIADLAEVPKANVHYYFKNKAALYNAVLANVIALWDEALAPINTEDDPKEILTQYVQKKVEFTRLYPAATRIFALELLQGAHHMSKHLDKQTRRWTRDRASEINSWVENKKILPVDPYHLIFLIWATTQHYAQAEVQVKSIYKKKNLTEEDFSNLSESLIDMVLRICGLEESS